MKFRGFLAIQTHEGVRARIIRTIKIRRPRLDPHPYELVRDRNRPIQIDEPDLANLKPIRSPSNGPDQLTRRDTCILFTAT
jgi:hypothetical protein